MPVNNIYNLNINNVASNGSVNFGNTIHKGYSVNQKQIGGQNIVGNSFNSPMTKFDKNIVSDPDIVDQVSKKF